MKIETFILGELATNCYLVWDENTKESLIIDPADEANFLAEQILQRRLNLKYLAVTHGHFDHLLAACELELAFKIPLLLYQDDLPLVKKMVPSATWWLKRKIWEKPPKNISFLKQGDLLKLGKTELEVIHTPGHSPGSLCFYNQKNKVLFTGDTLFAYGEVGRTDLPYSSEKDLKISIKKLSQFPPNTIIYPGHGENSTLGETLNLP